MMVMATHPLFAAFEAINALNSYVRTPSAWHLRDAVYSMKAKALAQADEMGAVVARNICVQGLKCKTCSGSGWWNIHRGAHCWTCGGKGTVELYFRESRLTRTLKCPHWFASDFTWHTPIRCAYPRSFEVETNWKPNQPGRELECGNVVYLLNVAEQVFPAVTIFPYSIFIGAEGPGCHYCNSEVELERYSIHRGRLHWTAAACASCAEHFKKVTQPRYGKTIFDGFRVPDLLLTPAVRTWCDRRGGVDQVTKTLLGGREW